MCPLSCDDKPNQMVCGSDGKDYRNECELHQQACKNQKNIRVQFHGPCDPCKDSENSLNTICRVQAVTRQPQLYKPPESCQLEPEPLCASDGHTYPSECAMTATGVQKGISLRKIHAGACGKLEVCREDCQFNAVCVVEQSGARCSCDPIECDETYKPLCSMDGSTFPNNCLRRKAECLSKSLIRTKQLGPCGE
ncbi:PREDICTED: agrin-like [Poecilia mexicana]|uniref:agrin-like n=1 Tax=Poecilia mexicana TaxID=48701 RepID=UPI00072E6EB9|nr:PREDICTED: agrin-like [Poecilia mexicana]